MQIGGGKFANQPRPLVFRGGKYSAGKGAQIEPTEAPAITLGWTPVSTSALMTPT